MYIAVKRDTVSREAVYSTVGIREDGPKEVLTYTVAPTESAYVWNELLQDVKARGVEGILLFISDGLAGMESAIEQVYPRLNTKLASYTLPVISFIKYGCLIVRASVRTSKRCIGQRMKQQVELPSSMISGSLLTPRCQVVKQEPQHLYVL